MDSTKQMPDAVDVAQASELTGLSQKAIRRRLERGTLESVKVGGRRMILVSELDRHDLLEGGSARPNGGHEESTRGGETAGAGAGATVAATSPGYPAGPKAPEDAPLASPSSEPDARSHVQPRPSPTAEPPADEQFQQAAPAPPAPAAASAPTTQVAPPTEVAQPTQAAQPAPPASAAAATPPPPPVAPAGAYGATEPYYAPGGPVPGPLPYRWYESRSIRILAVVLALAVIALLVWLLALRDSGESATVQPGGGPVAATQEDLIALSQRLHQPIYWAGNLPGTHMELSETSNSYAYLRYLTQDAPVGDSSGEFLTIGTYPATDAYRNLKGYARNHDAQTANIQNGGLAVTVPGSPTSIYFAYPHENVQVEVYDPQEGRALDLVKSGEVTPVTSVTTTSSETSAIPQG